MSHMAMVFVSFHENVYGCACLELQMGRKRTPDL